MPAKHTRLASLLLASLATASTAGGGAALADASCAGLPNQLRLRNVLIAANAAPGGLNFNMWATVVNRDGVVCAVAFTGADRGDQWPGSRVISAQKANTANAFSLPAFALSTGNLFSAVQPGGSLYGLQASNPVATDVAYAGPAEFFGQANDPMVGRRIGGVNVFGGGLGLYDSTGKLLGAIGVSGDTSCRDHRVAWAARHRLRLDYVPGGVSGDTSRPDNIVFDISSANATPGPDGNTEGGRYLSLGGFGHPQCDANEAGFAAALPATLKAVAAAVR